MRTIPTAFAVAIAIASSSALGCAVPRAVVVVDRSTAVQLSERYPSRVTVLKIAKPATVEERLTVHIDYRDGDVIPAEGVVGTGMSSEMMAGGVVLGLLGAGLLIGSVAGLTSCEPARSGGMMPDLGHGLCTFGWGTAAVAAGVMFLGGLALVIDGSRPSHLVIKKGADIALTPVVHQNGGGAALQLRF